ncbi:MAG: hypothetical protein LYZ70_05760 [Nitrososphaerales archaeon]|nr:hypothetical protein [Nitrososphaerales archaeon]
MVDLGDEFVCRVCGVVREKEVIEAKEVRAPQAVDYTGQALGGYLGPLDYGFKERFSRGFAASSSTFGYLKLVSDYSGREDSTFYACAKMIERVAEKLSLPRVVVGQAVVIAKKLFEVKRKTKEVTSATVSAYAIVTACKMLEVTSVSVREIVEAHRLLGRRVKTSAMIKLSLNSPFKTIARRPEDYVNRVVARLSSSQDAIRAIRGEGLNPPFYFQSLRKAAAVALGALEDADRGGHNPCSLAATAVYAAEVELSRQGFRGRVTTQREVAECGNVAEYTVREQYGQLFRPFASAPRSLASSRVFQTPELRT